MRNIYLIIIISLLQLSNNLYSNITLKINGIGTKNVLGYDFSSNNYPNMIYINGIKQPNITYNYNLNETNNFIELIWNNTINTCYHMFYECSDITEINLSSFIQKNEFKPLNKPNSSKFAFFSIKLSSLSNNK